MEFHYQQRLIFVFLFAIDNQIGYKLGFSIYTVTENTVTTSFFGHGLTIRRFGSSLVLGLYKNLLLITQQIRMAV
jgi:hypothetical protein